MSNRPEGRMEGNTRLVTITNQRGLHARAAAKFVKLAGEYDAEVMVSRKGQEVSGLSIMGLMMFAAGPGTDINLAAQGNEAEQVLDALQALIERRFDED